MVRMLLCERGACCYLTKSCIEVFASENGRVVGFVRSGTNTANWL